MSRFRRGVAQRIGSFERHNGGGYPRERKRDTIVSTVRGNVDESDAAHRTEGRQGAPADWFSGAVDPSIIYTGLITLSTADDATAERMYHRQKIPRCEDAEDMQG